MKISVIIPCFNELTTISRVLAGVRAAKPSDIEIIVVDDASTDGTRELLENELRPQYDLLLVHSHNRGKGAALRTGFAAATGEIIILQDADLEYSPDDYPSLLQPLLTGKADLVCGTRFGGGPAHRVLYFWHQLANQFITLCSNVMTNLNLTDVECGYKAFNRSLLERIHLEEERFGFEIEIVAKAGRLGCVIYEVSVSYAGRTYAEGKKVTWRDGFAALGCILKYNFPGS